METLQQKWEKLLAEKKESDRQLSKLNGVLCGGLHDIHPCCEGEICRCGEKATHKIAEVIQDPEDIRHEFTAYVCCGCFTWALTRAT